jgi:hypothetical protein
MKTGVEWTLKNKREGEKENERERKRKRSEQFIFQNHMTPNDHII